MSPPQVSGWVAMAMPQQKEACVWGPVPGRRGAQGKKERRGFTRATHSGLRGRKESSQRHKTESDCAARSRRPLSLRSKCHLNIKLSLGG